MKKIRHKKRKRRNILPGMIVLVLLAAVVLFLVKGNLIPQGPNASVITPSEGTNAGEEPSKSTEGEITAMPTNTPVPTPTPVPRDMEALKRELEGYIAAQSGKYGCYFINLITGETLGIHDRDEFIAASTTKLPMNLLLYKKIAANEIDPDHLLTYMEEDFEKGTGIIQDSEFGTQYTVRETAKNSIIHSDNCGINMIIRLLGIENIRAYMQELGATVYYGSRHRSCPYDLALYAKELYHFHMESPEIAGVLMEDLQNTQWNDRINKLLPESVKVAHKIGSFPEVYNDVGIVFAKEPYVLAVMSEDIDQTVASDVIAKISRTIYDYLEKSVYVREDGTAAE